MKSGDIILASASPRRREILSDMGISFEVRAQDIDESSITAPRASLLAKRLASAKAGSVNAGECTIIGADTIVVYRGKRYGKPQGREGAFEMLSALNGKWHYVYTGVCVRTKDKSISFCVRSRVKLKRLSNEQIYAYIDDCRPYDKAGAYGIQDKRIVQKYKGSYTNIVGLPKEKLARVLKRVGVTNGSN